MVRRIKLQPKKPVLANEQIVPCSVHIERIEAANLKRSTNVFIVGRAGNPNRLTAGGLCLLSLIADMSLAAPLEKSHQQSFRIQASSIPRRVAVVGGLVLADFACFTLADTALHWFGASPGLALFRGRNILSPQAVDLMVVIAVAFIVARYLAGDYSRRQLFWDGARATTGALLISGIIYIAAILGLQPAAAVPTLAIWVVLLFLVPSLRQLMRKVLGAVGLWNLPTAIIGTSRTAQDVCRALSKQIALGLDVRWLVLESTERNLPPALGGLRIISTGANEIVTTLMNVGCRQVVWVPDDRLRLEQNDLIDQLIGADIRVAIVPPLRRLPLFGLSTSSFFGRDLLLLQVRNNLARLPQRILKRSLDVVGSVLLLFFLSPLFLALALFIKLEDGGPIFFSQHRIGRRGLDFRCWKFRTMVVNAEELLAQWEREDPELLARYRESNFKLQEDPRTTRIGRWMRRKSLDELPQLFNTLIGQMSLVGPRPLLRRELPKYGPGISLYERVRPGISGLWQISGRSHTTFAERVSYDEWYIKNWTVWYDMVILLQTLWVLFVANDAY
jgi:undecaprenyl-phosphate galactose phosphotransferase